MQRKLMLTGWQRLGIVLSALWVLSVGGKAYIDYERVSGGGPTLQGFAVVTDAATEQRHTELSRREFGHVLALEAAKIRAAKNEKPTALDLIARLETDDSIRSGAGTGRHIVYDDFSAPIFHAHEPFFNDLAIVSLGIGALVKAIAFPLLCFWAAFFALRWVIAGFRKPQLAA